MVAVTSAMSTTDLEAYLARVGVDRRAPSSDALDELQTAHVRTFPFDNIDVLLGDHPGVELAAVQEKFVGRGRGGYCFEHATLFHAAVVALGYDATLLLSRVGEPDEAPRTHLVVVVEHEGRRLLCDPGIGVPPQTPIELVDGATAASTPWPHEIRRSDEGRAGEAWGLWRRRGEAWELMHTTDELPVRPVDVAMGHHWTSTAPSSHFLSSFTFNRHQVDPDGTPWLRTVNHQTVTDGRPGQDPVTRPYGLGEVPDLLASGGTRLTDGDLVHLIERVAALREAASGG